jgi:hypothetical protein
MLYLRSTVVYLRRLLADKKVCVYLVLNVCSLELFHGIEEFEFQHRGRSFQGRPEAGVV